MVALPPVNAPGVIARPRGLGGRPSDAPPADGRTLSAGPGRRAAVGLRVAGPKTGAMKGDIAKATPGDALRLLVRPGVRNAVPAIKVRLVGPGRLLPGDGPSPAVVARVPRDNVPAAGAGGLVGVVRKRAPVRSMAPNPVTKWEMPLPRWRPPATGWCRPEAPGVRVPAAHQVAGLSRDITRPAAPGGPPLVARPPPHNLRPRARSGELKEP